MSYKGMRKRAGLTQEKAADRIGSSHSSISAWEHNIFYPNIYYVLRMLKEYNCTFDELTEGQYEF